MTSSTPAAVTDRTSTEAARLRIDIWSDVVCPWCYIGKRRLESALAASGHDPDDYEIVLHSFQLDPAAPPEYPTSMAEHLGAKYGGGAAAGQQMMERVEAVAAEEGLLFALDRARTGNTRDAHRLLHLALDEGGQRIQSALNEELLAAYFLRGELVSDPAVLGSAAVLAGLGEERVREVLVSNEYDDAVEADLRQAVAFGATGVPFFVIDQRYGVSGAQPTEVFGRVLQRAWSDRAPALAVVDGDAADGCGTHGCA